RRPGAARRCPSAAAANASARWRRQGRERPEWAERAYVRGGGHAGGREGGRRAPDFHTAPVRRRASAAAWRDERGRQQQAQQDARRDHLADREQRRNRRHRQQAERDHRGQVGQRERRQRVVVDRDRRTRQAVLLVV